MNNPRAVVRFGFSRFLGKLAAKKVMKSFNYSRELIVIRQMIISPCRIRIYILYRDKIYREVYTEEIIGVSKNVKSFLIPGIGFFIYRSD